MECLTCHSQLIPDAAYCPKCSMRQDGVPECDTLDYAAFVSYRHREPDAGVAERLHAAIEAYRLPPAVAAAYGAPKLGRVFRDRDELPATGSLPAAIREALRHSKALVVVCSPATPGSRWVEQEIETFASYHGRERIFAVLAEGSSSESMPESLRTRMEPDSDGVPRPVPAEPLAADLRDPSRRQLSREKLRVVAAIAGCSFDDLAQRERTRRRKQAAIAAVAVLAIALALAFLGTQALQQREAALLEESQRLAAQSQQLFAQGDRYEAIETALAALPSTPLDINRPFLPSAQLALEQALEVYPSATPWRSLFSLTSDKQIKDIAISTESHWFAVLSASANIGIYDMLSGKHLASCELPTSEDGTSPSFSGTECILASENHVIYVGGGRDESAFCFDASTGKPVWTAGTKAPIAAALSGDGAVLALLERTQGTDACTLTTVGVESGQTQSTTDFTLESAAGFNDASDCHMCFADDGNAVFIVSPGLATKIDCSHSKTETVQQGNILAYVESATIENGNLVVCSHDAFSVSATNTSVLMLDANLSEVWATTLDTPTLFLENGMRIPAAPHCWGGVFDQKMDSGEKESIEVKALAVSAGTNVHLLDPETGETLRTIAGTKPVANASSNTASGLNVTFCDGTISSYRYPLTGELSESDTLVTNTGEYITTATHSPNRQYLIMQDASKTNRLKVFGRYTQYLLPSHESIDRFSKGYIGESVGFARYLAYLTQNCDYSRYAFVDQNRIKIYRPDGAYASITIDQLEPACNPSQIVQLRFSPADPDILYLLGYGTSSQLLLWSIDISEPSIVNCVDLSLVVPAEIAHGAVMLSSANDEALCMYTIYGALSINNPRELLAEALVRPPNAYSAIANAYRVGGIAVVQELTVQDSGGVSSRAAIIDIESDSEIDSDLAKYSIDIENSPSVKALQCNNTKTRVAEVCSDSMLRCFDLPSGKLVWETSCAIGANDHFEFSPDDKYLVARNATNQWVKIDADNGSIVCSAPAASDNVAYFHWSSDGKRLYATAQANSLSEYVLHTLSLEDDAFGIISSCYSGAIITQDENTIVAADGWGRFLLPRYSLDELITIAHEQLEQAGR